jgi:hypothetical protein
MNLKFWILIGLLEFRHRLKEEQRHHRRLVEYEAK